MEWDTRLLNLFLLYPGLTSWTSVLSYVQVVPSGLVLAVSPCG
jgi:hypothetical protein